MLDMTFQDSQEPFVVAQTLVLSPSREDPSVRLRLCEVSLPKGLARPVSTSSCSKTTVWDQEQTKAAQHSDAHAFFVPSQRWGHLCI